jgi:hypothetical protein
MSDARQDQFSPPRSARMVQKGSNVSGLGDSHGSFLRGPKEREIDPFCQGLGGELGRLVTCNYRLDNLRCQERQPHHSSAAAIALLSLKIWPKLRWSPRSLVPARASRALPNPSL